MKIYNINNTKEFFERLSSCRGMVKLVNENGEQIEINPRKMDSSLLPAVYVQGSIQQMEIIFQDAEDCRNIFSYLLNKRGLAA